jgi:serine/threonine protein kinase
LLSTDEPTRFEPGAGNALPVGTVLGEFRLDRVIGEGGFGIVYLAFDESLNRPAAIKEYMPSSLARRQPDGSVTITSDRHRETFSVGLRSFINEARLLAQFDHPALVKVFRFWEQNGTAYMVMPYYQGPTLKGRLAAQPALPSEAWLKSLLAPLTEALHHLHSENCFHRDIAPDNILLLPGDRPLLLDFGAARRIIGDMTQDLTVILKPGFAPIEQYAEIPSMRQGPWTDVYALAAVLYYAIARKNPVPSVGRMVNDVLVPACEIGAAHSYSMSFLAAIDAGLALRPEDRPPDMAAFRALLFGGDALSDGAGGETVVLPTPPRRTEPPPGRIEPLRMRTEPEAEESDQTRIGPSVRLPPQRPKRHRVAYVASVLVLLLATAVGIGWLWNARHRPEVPLVQAPVEKPAIAPVPPPVSPPPVSRVEPPSPQLQNPPAPIIAEPLSPATPPRPPTSPGRPIRPPAPAAQPDSLRWLSQLSAVGDPNIEVKAAASPSAPVIGRDAIRIHVSSSQAGYLYVLQRTSDGRTSLLIPPAQRVPIRAGRPIVLGSAGDFIVGGPAGEDQILVVVARLPRSFARSALHKVNPDEWQYEAREIQLAVAQNRLTEALLGDPLCPSGQHDCDPGFGAALFKITERLPYQTSR